MLGRGLGAGLLFRSGLALLEIERHLPLGWLLLLLPWWWWLLVVLLLRLMVLLLRLMVLLLRLMVLLLRLVLLGLLRLSRFGGLVSSLIFIQ